MMQLSNEDDETVEEQNYQTVNQGSPENVEKMRKRLPQNEDEERLNLSTRSRLAEEGQLQVIRLTESKDEREKEKGKKKRQMTSTKYMLAGLAIIAIMILVFAFNQKQFMRQTLPLGIKQAQNEKEEKDSSLNSQVGSKTIKLELKQKEIIQSAKEKQVRPLDNHISEKGKPAEHQLSMNISKAQQSRFTVPQFLWTFSENLQGNSFFVKKNLEAMKRRTEKSSLTMTILNSNNYKSYLKPQTAHKIQNIIKIIKERMTNQPKSNLKKYFQEIQRRLICFHVLNQNGGVFLEKNVLLTESFDWLNDIQRNIYVNKGSDKAKAKYFGFFDYDHSSHLDKHNKSGVAFEQEKYLVQYPTFQPYFLAALPNQTFLTETMAEYVDLLVNPTSLHEKMRKYNLYMQVLQGKDLYYEVFYTSQLIVLHRKQQQIDSSGRNRYGNTFAIDQYGLMTMNERYFPRKLAFFFSSYSEQKIYKYIAKANLPDMEATTGPMRYIVILPLENEFNRLLERAKQQQQYYFINPDSLFGRNLITNHNESYVLRDYEKNTVNEKGKPWDRLPKIIWFYWDTGIKNSKVANKLCYENIKRDAALNHFEVREVNDSNLAQYLGPQLNAKINNYISNKKIPIHPQTKSDFVRLGLMIRYGGIYMDLSYFSIKGLEWIVNITQAPSESIFNRYGEMPRTFMFFHPHYGTPYNWTYDKEANTKNLLLSAYQSNLMIGEPNQPLYIDWLEQFGRFVTTPYKQTQQRMKDIGVFGYRWTKSSNQYLAVMDSIKNVMAIKNRAILEEIKRNPDYKGPKSAPQFYGLWSVNGYREQQKFISYTNFDHTYNKHRTDMNIFLWRFSETYVIGILGNITHLVKLYSRGIKEFNNFLNSGFYSNFSDLHPQSFAAKYLYRPELHKLSIKDGQLTLELLQP